ncbi:GntR family transcriptional regulator [Inquilinus sp.]|uniref:GntR family transcriptional regulator n=1 Tax=Inquilinus sp. TaxID=1932117 RepID=UPI0031E2E3AA
MSRALRPSSDERPSTLPAGGAPNLSRIAYERFKEALFERRLQPGAFMSQAELVEIVGSPLGPLREALQVLQAEGLVTIRPRAGIEIAKPDLPLVRNSYQLRLFLETPAIRHFAEAAPRDRIEAMIAQHREVVGWVDGTDLDRDLARRIEEVDLGLHLGAIDALDNPLLRRAFLQTQDYIRLIRLDHHYAYSAAKVRRTMAEHQEILEACLARDPDAAEAALRTHLTQSIQRAMGL